MAAPIALAHEPGLEGLHGAVGEKFKAASKKSETLASKRFEIRNVVYTCPLASIDF